MPVFKIEKSVSTLPAVLTADTVYAVRTGVGFDLYITDSTGAVAHALNSGGSTVSNTFIQETEPSTPSPYIWYKTNAEGKVVDILKG